MLFRSTKAIFLIVLGSFLMATGFAFARENVALDQAGLWLDKSALNDAVVASGGSPAPAPAVTTAAPAVSPAVAVPTPPAVTTPPPAPKPTLGESVKSFLGEHRRDILLGGIGAYLGWALVGTMAGALTGGLFFLAFFWFAAL